MSQVATTLEGTASLRERMDGMYRKDCVAASILVALLWMTIFFVILAVRSLMPTSVEIACFIAAGVLLLFNTASITAMIRHYGEDKHHIYSIDIRHLDAGR